MNPNSQRASAERSPVSMEKCESAAGNDTSSSTSEAAGNGVDVSNLFLDELIERLMRAPMKPATKRTPRSQPTAPDVDVQLSVSEIFRLCYLASDSFLKQDSLLVLSADQLPVTVVGDIHGQFRELRLLLHHHGAPADETTYVFLGDYVDRGPQAVEVMALLLALKIRYPFRFFMLRGNHEDFNTTMVYGFYDECARKYPDDLDQLVYQSFVHTFNCMPFACLIGNKILTMHGGISPNLNTLDDVNKIERPTFVPLFGLCTDLVWADPGANHVGWNQSNRGISFMYDDTVIEEFCRKHDLDLIVRGHQISNDMLSTGYRMTENGRMLTLFSAFNYINMRNTGATLTISPGLKLNFHCFRPLKFGKAEESEVAPASR